jgi:hypothetical protein
VVRNLLRDVSVPVRDSILEGLAQKRIERFGDTPNRRRIIAHRKGANKGHSAQRVLLSGSHGKASVVLHILGWHMRDFRVIRESGLTHPLKHRRAFVETDGERYLCQVLADR